MEKIVKKYKYQILLVIIGLAWMLTLNFFMQVGKQGYIYADSDNYREAGSYLYHDLKAHYYRPAGMAAVFGLPYLFGGDDADVYAFSFYINMCCWLGTALLLFRFLRRYFSEYKALILSSLFYTLIGSAFMVFHLLTESIFTFIIILAFYLVDRFKREDSYKYLAYAVSLLILAVLVKPGAKFLAIALIVFFSRILIRNYKRSSNILIFASIATVMFFCFKMKEAYGNFTVSYIDGVTYYNYLGSNALSLKEGRDIDEKRAERMDYIFGKTFPEMKTIAAEDFKEQMTHNTKNIIKAYFLDIITNTKAATDCIAICKNIDNAPYFETLKQSMMFVSKYQNRIFTVLGVILALWYCAKSYKNPDVYTLMGLYILYTIAISGISSNQGDRFHAVFFPFVIILAGKLYAERFSKNTLPQ